MSAQFFKTNYIPHGKGIEKYAYSEVLLCPIKIKKYKRYLKINFPS